MRKVIVYFLSYNFVVVGLGCLNILVRVLNRIIIALQAMDLKLESLLNAHIYVHAFILLQFSFDYINNKVHGSEINKIFYVT